MSLNITVSIPLPIALSIHQSSDPNTGSLSPAIQQNILRSIVSAIKTLPDDTSTWGLQPTDTNSHGGEEAEDERSTSPPEHEIRVSFSDTDTYIPTTINRKLSFRNRNRRASSSAKDSVIGPQTPPATALQKPSGPDICFPNSQFAFEIRQGSARSLAVAAHAGVTSAELAMAIWKKEGIPMREQRLYAGSEEIYNGRAHERDGVYELMHLRGKFSHIGQGSVVVLVVGQGKRSPRVG